MAADRISVKTFGIAQGAVLVAVVVTFVLYRRRARFLGENLGPQPSKLGVRSSIQRTAAPPGGKAPAGQKATEPPQVGSALPVWGKTTPPHEILGVGADADEATIEAAYRKLLKQYHPDRFASWGQGYQNRAHQVIILLQDARVRMLANAGGKGERR